CPAWAASGLRVAMVVTVVALVAVIARARGERPELAETPPVGEESEESPLAEELARQMLAFESEGSQMGTCELHSSFTAVETLRSPRHRYRGPTGGQTSTREKSYRSTAIATSRDPWSETTSACCAAGRPTTDSLRG